MGLNPPKLNVLNGCTTFYRSYKHGTEYRFIAEPQPQIPSTKSLPRDHFPPLASTDSNLHNLRTALIKIGSAGIGRAPPQNIFRNEMWNEKTLWWNIAMENFDHLYHLFTCFCQRTQAPFPSCYIGPRQWNSSASMGVPQELHAKSVAPGRELGRWGFQLLSTINKWGFP